MSEEIKILKVNFNNISLTEASDLVIKWAKEERQKHICTPNPEIVLLAQKNPKFLNILNGSDLNIADGIGILWAAKYLSLIKNDKSKWLKRFKGLITLAAIIFNSKYIKNPLRERVTGVDLMDQICKKAVNNKIRIFLLGAAEGVAEKVKKILEEKYLGLHIIDTYAGSPEEKFEKEIIKKINSSEAHILFVAYGAPTQELWIDRNLGKIPEVKVAIGVGGAFDFIANIHKRAPKWMQKLGIEWLYRLFQQPSRLKRIYNATIKFPRLVLNQSTNQENLKKRIKTWLAQN